MARIAIIGVGRIGTAAAKIILTLTDHTVLLIDSNTKALEYAVEACDDVERTQHQQMVSPKLPIEVFAIDEVNLAATLKYSKPDIILCATPFYMNVEIATIASELEIHYLDFTEDNSVTADINKLQVSNCTFVPQTGLAPGLVAYIGLSLFKDLGVPKSLALRVGALPQVAFGPAQYAITWSPEGLINQYLNPAYRKVRDKVEQIEPLQELETVVCNGVQYEGFSTAGGVGDLTAYDRIPNVDYKTLRFPGHCDFLHNFFGSIEEQEDQTFFEAAVESAKQTFETTCDDVVVLVAHAVDVNGKSASAGLHFYPDEQLRLTAVELTTAGTGLAVAQLILDGKLPKGILKPSDISFSLLLQTSAMAYVLDAVM